MSVSVPYKNPCPRDSNGDGDCGQPACSWCGPQATDRTRLLADLDQLVRGSYDERRAAGERIADRIESIESRQRAAEQHDPDCPEIAEPHLPDGGPAPCNCWLSKPTKET